MIVATPVPMRLSAAKALELTLERFQISGADLAKRTGLKPQQISYFKQGKRSPRIETFLSVVDGLPLDARRFYLSLFFGVEVFHCSPEQMPDQLSSFAQFLAKWQERAQVTQLELELAIQQRTLLSLESLKEIQEGRPPTIEEIGWIGAIVTKPDGSGFTIEELIAIRDQDRHFNDQDESSCSSHS